MSYMNFTYQHAALGGTFDHLHRGHRHLLDAAFQVSQHVHIGLTQDSMNQSKVLASGILPYPTRERELEEYLQQHNLASRVTIIPLADIYGTTLSDSRIEAVIITPHTLNGANQINTKRKQLHLTALPIIQADLIKDQSGDYISSTKIRQGVIDREGRVYQNILSQDLVLSDQQKKILSKPQGQLLVTDAELSQILDSHRGKIALVGDFITQWFDDHQLHFDYSIIDGFNQRQPFEIKLHHWQPKHQFRSSNPPGTINASAFQEICQLISHSQGLLEIKGEEDLTVLPLLLSLPLDSLVFYGQPGQGIVMMRVTEAVKHKYAQFLDTNF